MQPVCTEKKYCNFNLVTNVQIKYLKNCKTPFIQQKNYYILIKTYLKTCRS